MGCTPSSSCDHSATNGEQLNSTTRSTVVSQKNHDTQRLSPSAQVQPAVCVTVSGVAVGHTTNRTAPRASLESDGFDRSSKRNSSLIDDINSNNTIGGMPSRYPTANAGRALALTPEDEPDTLKDSASSVKVVEPPPDLFKIPDEPFQLWWWSSLDGDSWGVGRFITAACSHLGGTATVLMGDAVPPKLPSAATPPHCLLVDARGKKLQELRALVAWSRNSYGQHVYLIAVVSKSTYIKDDDTLRHLLEMGFDRVLENTGGAMRWRAEMAQAAAAGRTRRGAQAGASALLAALRACAPMGAQASQASHAPGRVSICASDGSTILTVGEGADADSADPHVDTGVTPLRQRIAPYRGSTAWHSILAWPRSIAGGGRGSLASLRRDSSQAEGMRRTSLARLALEAPITKAAALLEAAANAAASGAAASAATLVIRAADALRAVDLYRPDLHNRGKHERALMDPLAGDLVAALLAQPAIDKGTQSSRRSSGDSVALRAQTSKINTELNEYKILTAGIMNWHWDIFLLERASRRRPLVPAGAAIFAHFDVASTLNCEDHTLHAWLALIEENYHANIAYHTATHAADVMQAVAVFVQRGVRVAHALGPFGITAALLAAVAHDVGHPGASAAFLCNSKHPLALLYNDQSVLESHHAALTFRLTLSDDRVNIFKGLDRDQFQTIRRDIVDMILATEMTKHFEHLAKFVNVFNGKPHTDIEQMDTMQDDMDSSWDSAYLEQSENINLVKRMLIKTADVSNTSRPMKICIEWASRICEEYFSQTETEKALGLPVVMPGFERSTCSVPRSQKAFYDYIISDMMDAWASFVDMPELTAISRDNSERWRQMEEHGIVTLQDIKKAPANLKENSLDESIKPATGIQ